jgi:hypothetical protein
MAGFCVKIDLSSQPGLAALNRVFAKKTGTPYEVPAVELGVW